MTENDAAGPGPGRSPEAAPPALAPEKAGALVAGMAVESWRFGRAFIRLLSRADAGDQGRFESQLRWFLKKVEDSLQEAGMRIVTLEGRPYDPGMPAAAVNIEDFAGWEGELLVDQMLEPVIIDLEGRLVRNGTVTLRRQGGGE